MSTCENCGNEEGLHKMKYDISIRVNFPEEITSVLRKEKQRYINDYGSSYKSEPHITLYLDSYTVEGYPKLLDQCKHTTRN